MKDISDWVMLHYWGGSTLLRWPGQEAGLDEGGVLQLRVLQVREGRLQPHRRLEAGEMPSADINPLPLVLAPPSLSPSENGTHPPFMRSTNSSS